MNSDKLDAYGRTQEQAMVTDSSNHRRQPMESEKKQCCGDCKYLNDRNVFHDVGDCVYPVPEILPEWMVALNSRVQKTAGSTCPAFTPRKDNEK